MPRLYILHTVYCYGIIMRMVSLQLFLLTLECVPEEFHVTREGFHVDSEDIVKKNGFGQICSSWSILVLVYRRISGTGNEFGRKYRGRHLN
jgi:hypothetical protein